MAGNDFGGLKADRLRVKITLDGRQAGRFVKYGGQIGFKNKAGEWTNRFVDLMWPGPWCHTSGRELAKGDVVFISGRVTIEDSTYNGQQRTQRVIWADSISANQDGYQGQTQQAPRQSGDQGGQRPAFPGDSTGMDDVPF